MYCISHEFSLFIVCLNYARLPRFKVNKRISKIYQQHFLFVYILPVRIYLIEIEFLFLWSRCYTVLSLFLSIYIYVYIIVYEHDKERKSRSIWWNREKSREREKASKWYHLHRSKVEKPCYGRCSPSLCIQTRLTPDANAHQIDRKE